MRSRHIRAFGLLVPLVAGLGVASIAAAASSTDRQISRQTERRLSEDAFSHVTVSVQASLVSLDGIVPSLSAEDAAIEEAREASPLHGVVTQALKIERAESDAVLEQDVVDAIR